MPGVGPAGLNITAGISGRITNTNVLGSLGEDINVSALLQLLGGTGAGQIDTVYSAQTTIAASGSSTIDLNGAVNDVFGNSIAFLHVKAIVVIAAAGNTNDFQIGPGASNPFNGPWSGTTPLHAVSPGEMFVATKGQGSSLGWAVVAATGDIIKIANSSSGTSVTANIYIFGTST